MQNRFGLKDFIFLILLLVVGISIWISMWQEDRRFEDVRQIERQMGRVEQQIAMLSQRLEEGVVARAPSARGDQAERDADWARPGIEIQWQEPMQFANDPRNREDFAVGGSFTEIFEAQPPKITPYLYTDVYGRRVNEQVVDSLARYHPETVEWQGVLAEAWQLDPELMWLRVKIRPNARFSDGVPVTARDVQFSYEFFMDPEIEAPRWRGNYALVDRIEVIDDLVVEFHFEEPNFVNKERALTMFVIPEHFYSDFTSSEINQSTGLLMGSGPYRLRTLDPDNQWTPPNEIVLVRNEQYWGPRSPLVELRFRTITDDLARLTDYNNRNADMIRPTSRQYVRYKNRDDWLKSNRAMQWYNLRGGYSFICWNGGRRGDRQTPFHDARVRRAMTHLLDRQYIIDNIYEGIGEIATGPFNPETAQANPDIVPLEHNVEKARQLLAEAGWTPDNEGVLRNERGDRFSFEFTYSTGSEAVQQVAQYLSDQCSRVGIRMEHNRVDWSIYATLLTNRDFDAITMAWSPSTPEGDPYQIWHSDNIGGGADNFAQWNNPRADELIDSGRTEVDPDKRREKWHELHQLIHEEQPYTFLMVRPWLRFINREVENAHPYMTGLEYREFFIALDQQLSPM